jgi:hypothetical protein
MIYDVVTSTFGFEARVNGLVEMSKLDRQVTAAAGSTTPGNVWMTLRLQ